MPSVPTFIQIKIGICVFCDLKRAINDNFLIHEAPNTCTRANFCGLIFRILLEINVGRKKVPRATSGHDVGVRCAIAKKSHSEHTTLYAFTINFTYVPSPWHSTGWWRQRGWEWDESIWGQSRMLFLSFSRTQNLQPYAAHIHRECRMWGDFMNFSLVTCFLFLSCKWFSGIFQMHKKLRR